MVYRASNSIYLRHIMTIADNTIAAAVVIHDCLYYDKAIVGHITLLNSLFLHA